MEKLDIKKIKDFAKEHNTHLGNGQGVVVMSALEAIERKEALDRLFDNDDFNKIIEEGYMKDELRNLSVGATNLTLSQDQRSNIRDMLASIGYLGSYFRDITNMANEALAIVKGHMEEEAQREQLQDEENLVAEQDKELYEQDIS